MQTSYNRIPVPSDGQVIGYADGNFTVPDRPIIPFIAGDGTGRLHRRPLYFAGVTVRVMPIAPSKRSTAPKLGFRSPDSAA